MDRTNYYSGLNPVVVQALNNLQYRYGGETPEMWCSRIQYPFKKLLEYNPKYFSKNGFIQMIERSYKDGEFKTGRRSFHIYCTVCDSLVIIRKNTIEYGNDHLKKCIAERRSKSIQKNTKKGGRVPILSSNEIDKIYQTYWVMYSKGLNHYAYDYSHEGRKRIVNRLSDSAKIIQQAWRAFKLRPETWAKQVWNMVRNDGTPNEKKFIGIDFSIKKAPDNYIAYDVDKKKDQLRDRLNLVSHIVAFIELHRQGYRIVQYADWSYSLKWLSNPEDYRINEFGNEYIVKSSEYARYICKIAGKPYPCDLLKIYYYESGCLYFQGKDVIIDFSDFNNNCEYVQRIFRTIESILK